MITISDVKTWVDKVVKEPCEISPNGFQIVPDGVDAEASREAMENLLRTLSGNDKAKVHLVMVPLLIPFIEEYELWENTVDGKAVNTCVGSSTATNGH